MKRLLFVLIATVPLITLWAQKEPDRFISTIAFGSCGSQNQKQPILSMAADHKPDVWIYLGDNIYGDSYDMNEIRAKYALLAAQSDYQKLIATTPILATWDDHDFGWNDSGRHYNKKDSTKKIFLEFFKIPATDERYKRPGIYTSKLYEQNGKRLQIILLDTRTFRDQLRIYRGELSRDDRYFYPLDYYPHHQADSTLLGAAQWQWLEQELRKPADLRIIASSTQFGIEFNGYEAWANFPSERDRFMELLQKTKANGVLFISGDVHYAEISKYKVPGCYPIYDITASGITSTWLFATPNRYRIEGPVMDNHFGKITIGWNEADPSIKMEIFDVHKNQRVEHTIRLSEISFSPATNHADQKPEVKPDK
jgi:alkaline phosphatase D